MKKQIITLLNNKFGNNKEWLDGTTNTEAVNIMIALYDNVEEVFTNILKADLINNTDYIVNGILNTLNKYNDFA